MKKFEKVSQNLLLGCENVADANDVFTLSCKVCTSCCVDTDCGDCAVGTTHMLVIAALSDSDSNADTDKTVSATKDK